jgi:hypothetical protein
MRSKHEKIGFENPGPGTYNPRQTFDAMNNIAPSYS